MLVTAWSMACFVRSLLFNESPWVLSSPWIRRLSGPLGSLAPQVREREGRVLKLWQTILKFLRSRSIIVDGIWLILSEPSHSTLKQQGGSSTLTTGHKIGQVLFDMALLCHLPRAMPSFPLNGQPSGTLMRLFYQYCDFLVVFSSLVMCCSCSGGLAKQSRFIEELMLLAFLDY